MPLGRPSAAARAGLDMVITEQKNGLFTWEIKDDSGTVLASQPDHASNNAARKSATKWVTSNYQETGTAPQMRLVPVPAKPPTKLKPKPRTRMEATADNLRRQAHEAESQIEGLKERIVELDAFARRAKAAANILDDSSGDQS